MSLLHSRFPQLQSTLPYLALGTGPTPVRRLTGKTLDGGSAPTWLKDDGVYGSIYGGNKVRKLEWLLADAKQKGRRSIFTAGGLGTNHGLATAIYSRRLGMKTSLALIDQPIDEHVNTQLRRLREVAAVTLTRTVTRTYATAPWLLLRLAISDRRLPYILGPGGSSPLGTLGYVEASLELARQVETSELPEPSHVVVPVGSAGTAAGLLLGLKMAGLSTRVVGVVVADQLRLDADVIARLAQKSARLLSRRGARFNEIDVAPAEVDVTRDWLGAGYGHSTTESETAQEVALDEAGIRLDPVYSAKAFAALVALNRGGFFGRGPVLFINTFDALSTS